MSKEPAADPVHTGLLEAEVEAEAGPRRGSKRRQKEADTVLKGRGTHVSIQTGRPSRR